MAWSQQQQRSWEEGLTSSGVTTCHRRLIDEGEIIGFVHLELGIQCSLEQSMLGVYIERLVRGQEGRQRCLLASACHEVEYKGQLQIK